VSAYVEQFADQRDENVGVWWSAMAITGEREVLTAAGAVTVTAPRSTTSASTPTPQSANGFPRRFCPPGAQSPQMTEVLPLLYLHGLSTCDFGPAWSSFWVQVPDCRPPRSLD